MAMIQGVGMDLIEIKRIREATERRNDFPGRVLTARELDLYQSRHTEQGQAEFLAGRWAAKEAFGKALGSGIGLQVSFHDLAVLADEKDRPYIETDLFTGNIWISISHTHDYAGAIVILED